MNTTAAKELTGAALDWAAAKALKTDRLPYSSDWQHGGPVIERHIFKVFKNVGGTYTAQVKTRGRYYSPTYGADIDTDVYTTAAGPTMLIAAMRALIASRLGDSVEIPNTLTGD